MAEIFTVSSEEKVFHTKKPESQKKGTMARNEVFAFQVAYRFNRRDTYITVKIDSPIKDYITYRQVDFVPCTTPNLVNDDENQLFNVPCLCPDVLRPCEFATSKYNVYSSLWFTVKGDLPVGKHKIKITLVSWGEEYSCDYTLEVLDFKLVDADFTYTNWFHYDSISSYYGLRVFSKKYNKIMYSFIKCAIEHGMNMLLIPMFTPPLDTKIGSYRRTVQLVDVEVVDGVYHFSFDRLINFMKSVQKLGIKYFEMSHLFTQWGAYNAPKIEAVVNGKRKRIFGWDFQATSPEYEHFLSCFLPALAERLKAEELFELCRFHISDEPNEKCLESYKSAKEIFKRYLPDGIITDALSHYEFYKDGLVEAPVCATDAITPFLENNVPNMWTYYCCAQTRNNVSNRFMSYPGFRNRVIGLQLYLNNIKGFLHWGYNFYNSVLSVEEINPYLVTDAGNGGLQSGDAFSVYPGKDGPYDSIRHEVFYAGLQDMRLMLTLEKKLGREACERLLLDNGFKKDFHTYPLNEKALSDIRLKAQKLICEV